MTRFLRILPLLVLGLALPSRASTVVIDSTTGPGRCEVYDSVSGTRQALAPEQTEVRAVLTDGIAEIEVVQIFTSSLAKASEAIYVFPLPHKGAVHGMRYLQKGVWRDARILEKQQATAIYDSVKQAGGSAALLVQVRPDVFSQSISRIEPGDTVEVRLRLSMPLVYRDGTFEFAFPTMVGSRCCNSGTPPLFGTLTGWNPPANVEGPRIRFLVAMQTGYPVGSISSPTHPIRVLQAAAAVDSLVGRGWLRSAEDLPLPFRHAVFLQPQNTYPNSDFVLRFSRAEAQARASAAAFPDTGAWKYFRIEAYPDTSWFSGDRGDLDVMLLQDISGSQDGWPLEHEKRIIGRILDRLRPTDRLCLMAFSNQPTLAFADTLRHATAGNLAAARAFADAQIAGGGTDLLEAVQALTAIPGSRERRKLYVFLTDGFITNEGAILAHLKTVPDLQAITFGAGNNLNRAFLDQAAEVGDGFSVALTENDDLEARVGEAWSRLQAPAVDSVVADFGSLPVADLIVPGGRRLYRGLAWTALGRTRSSGTASIELVGRRQGQTVRIPVSLDLGVQPLVGWAVPKLWARARIEALELADPRGDSRKDSIIALSIAHQVLSRYTAFLAWDGAAPLVDMNVIRAAYSVGGASPSYYSLEVEESPIHRTQAVLAPLASARLIRRTGALFLSLDPTAGIREVRLFDLHGRLLWSSPSLSQGVEELPLPARLPAMVVVRARTEAGWFSRALPVLK